MVRRRAVWKSIHKFWFHSGALRLCWHPANLLKALLLWCIWKGVWSNVELACSLLSHEHSSHRNSWVSANHAVAGKPPFPRELLCIPFFYPLLHTFLFEIVPLQPYLSRCSHIKRNSLCYTAADEKDAVCALPRDWQSASVVLPDALAPSLNMYVHRQKQCVDIRMCSFPFQKSVSLICAGNAAVNLCYVAEFISER